MSLLREDLANTEPESKRSKTSLNTYSGEYLRLSPEGPEWVPIGIMTAKLPCRAAQKLARRFFEHAQKDIQTDRLTVRITDTDGHIGVYDLFYGPAGAARKAYDMASIAKTHKIKRSLWPLAPVAM